VQGNGWTPVAGNFAPNHPGDEIGLFNAGKWVLDSNGNYNLGDSGDLQLNGSMHGIPFTGDFDGDGKTDLGTYDSVTGTFSIDLAANGLTGNADVTINASFAGTGAMPVTGDFNLDGVTDLGLYLPEGNGPEASELPLWYILISTGTPVAGTVNTLNHPFSPAPVGNDLFYQFGNVSDLPLVGNFDPPLAADSTPTTPTLPPLQSSGDLASLVNLVALPGASSGTPLQVRVTDALGDPVGGARVTFAAPATGAGGALAANATVLTDAQGIATAPLFTPNAVAGSYSVTATANDFGTAVAIGLTNTPAPPAVSTPGVLPSSVLLGVSPARVAGQSLTLTAQVSGSSGPATGSIRFFDVFRGRIRFLGAAQLSDGSADLEAALPAGLHGLQAVYLGDNTYAASTAILRRLVVRRGHRPHAAARHTR
jgi:hypothetical protein